jgi:hypothetical protein
MKTTLFASLLTAFALCACNTQFGHPNPKLTQHLNASGMPAKLTGYDVREVRVDCHSADGHPPYKVTLYVEDNYGLKTLTTPESCEQSGQTLTIAPAFSGSDKFQVRSSEDYAPELMDRYLAYLPALEHEQSKF